MYSPLVFLAFLGAIAGQGDCTGSYHLILTDRSPEVLAFELTVGKVKLDVSEILTIPNSPVKTAVSPCNASVTPSHLFNDAVQCQHYGHHLKDRCV